MLHNRANERSRFCDNKLETMDDLVSGCSILTPNGYKNRHDGVGQYLHWKILHQFSLEIKSNCYEHHPEPVSEGGNITTLCDFPVYTDRTIQPNRQDIIVKERSNNTCLLVGMSVPSDKNVSAKVSEKLSKYKDLEIEIERMWYLKTKTIPVVMGALGLIQKGTADYLKRTQEEPSLNEFQVVVLNSTTI